MCIWGIDMWYMICVVWDAGIWWCGNGSIDMWYMICVVWDDGIWCSKNGEAIMCDEICNYECGVIGSDMHCMFMNMYNIWID